MTTFIKTKFKISDDQTNIDKNRITANITEYHIISKSIFQRIIIPKFMMIRQLFHVKMYVIMSKINMSIMRNHFLVTIIQLLPLYIFPNASGMILLSFK